MFDLGESIAGKTSNDRQDVGEPGASRPHPFTKSPPSLFLLPTRHSILYHCICPMQHCRSSAIYGLRHANAQLYAPTDPFEGCTPRPWLFAAADVPSLSPYLPQDLVSRQLTSNYPTTVIADLQPGTDARRLLQIRPESCPAKQRFPSCAHQGVGLEHYNSMWLCLWRRACAFKKRPRPLPRTFTATLRSRSLSACQNSQRDCSCTATQTCSQQKSKLPICLADS